MADFSDLSMQWQLAAQELLATKMDDWYRLHFQAWASEKKSKNQEAINFFKLARMGSVFFNSLYDAAPFTTAAERSDRLAEAVAVGGPLNNLIAPLAQTLVLDVNLVDAQQINDKLIDEAEQFKANLQPRVYEKNTSDAIGLAGFLAIEDFFVDTINKPLPPHTREMLEQLLSPQPKISFKPG